MAQQYIMTIENLTRMYDEKEILSDIWLSFLSRRKNRCAREQRLRQEYSSAHYGR